MDKDLLTFLYTAGLLGGWNYGKNLSYFEFYDGVCQDVIIQEQRLHFSVEPDFVQSKCAVLS